MMTMIRPTSLYYYRSPLYSIMNHTPVETIVDPHHMHLQEQSGTHCSYPYIQLFFSSHWGIMTEMLNSTCIINNIQKGSTRLDHKLNLNSQFQSQPTKKHQPFSSSAGKIIDYCRRSHEISPCTQTLSYNPFPTWRTDNLR